MSPKGSIYISNLPAAQNIALLRGTQHHYKAKGIKAILSAARSGLLNHKRGEIDHYLYLPI